MKEGGRWNEENVETKERGRGGDSEALRTKETLTLL